MSTKNNNLTYIESLTYEKATSELEDIVGKLESGEHSLEESLELFERGQFLAKRCADLLEKAELKIRQLSSNNENLSKQEEEN